MSSAGKNEGISGMGHSSSLTSMSSAGLGGRVVTERGLGIMAASGLLVGWILSVSGRRRYGRYACRRSRCDVVRRAVVEAETAACRSANCWARIALISAFVARPRPVVGLK